MKNSIVEKLASALSEPVDDECKVVYVLAESRKLLETYRTKYEQFALRLYCNWALHVNLNRNGTTLKFLKLVDRFAKRYLNENENFNEDLLMLREFVYLDSFRQQFKNFLEAYGLSTAICDQNNRWHEFLTCYAGVIEDCSLSCKANDGELTRVKKVVFAKGRTFEDHYLPFSLKWTIVLVNDAELIVETRASAPNGNEMISSIITLKGERPSVKLREPGESHA